MNNQNQNKILLASILSLVFIATGCMVGPDFQKPQLKPDNSWSESVANNQIDSSTQASTENWWKLFNDTTLNTLIEKAGKDNLSLQVAGLRILEAQALRGIAKGYQLPQMQQINASYAKRNNSEKDANQMPVSEYSDYRASFDVAWELDVWGKYRRSIQAADAQLGTTIMTYNDAWVSMTSEIALAYTELCAFDKRIELLEKNIEIHAGTLKLVQAKYDAGTSTELDLQQAKSVLASVKSSLPMLQSGRYGTISRLCVLLSVAPGKLDELLAQSKAIPQVPTKISVGMPADLLRRRADIRIAEHNAIAQCARIGIEKTELLPQFYLTGSIGYSAEKAKDLFSDNSETLGFGPSFKWNVLNYGRITNRVKAADIRYQQALTAYDLTVIGAMNEVEISIFKYLQSQLQVKSLAESEAASQRALDLALQQYNHGLVSFDRVLDSQAFLVQQQDKLTTARRDVVQNLIVLYKSLGGGWDMIEKTNSEK
ncbi:MAG: efflux transporter outer membrane subunit [Phycisphaerae bacterium]|nr:efflux transporter outer membrane subunit [Phycisphaerae bacterium]